MQDGPYPRGSGSNINDLIMMHQPELLSYHYLKKMGCADPLRLAMDTRRNSLLHWALETGRGWGKIGQRSMVQNCHCLLRIISAFVRCETMVLGLLKLKADPNHQNADGDTPLHVVATKHPCKTCHLNLLFFKAYPNMTNKKGRYPIHCLDLGSQKSTAILLEVLKTGKFQLDAKDGRGNTLAHLAVLGNHVQHLKKLVKHDSSLARKIDQSLQTPLHLAVRMHRTRLVKTLLEDGEASTGMTDVDGRTPLMVLFTSKVEKSDEALEIIHCLVTGGSDVKATDKNGQS